MKNLIMIWMICFPIYLISQIKFSNQTSSLFPNTNHFSGSVIGISDLNGDALDDILRLGNGQNLSLAYQQGPGMPFTLVQKGPQTFSQFWNVSIADINHDGLNDFVLAANELNTLVYYAQKIKDSIIYQFSALDSSQYIYAQAGNLVDINNDGWLDYFLCNDLGLNRIWANNKSGEIRNAPVNWIDFKTKIPSDNSGNYGSTWNDFDNDGDLDLYIAKCKAGAQSADDPRRINLYYRNDGNTIFREVGSEIGLASGAQSWMAVAGDPDNDGDQDIFVINHFSASQLFINNGKGIFTDQYATSGINYNDIGVQAAWLDIDNDGWQDLLISGSRHHIYRNKGNLQFELLDPSILGRLPIESFAYGDLNNDGKLDMYASHSNLFNDASFRPDQVWINNTSNSNHFIKIRLEGVQSNKSAIGARLILHTKNKIQIRDVQSGYSYGVHNSLVQHFGTGTETSIDSLVIKWPSGRREKIISPFIDRTIVIKENLCFGFDPILTSIPIKNILCTASDSVRLQVPITGTYTWTTGNNERSIVVKTPGNYQVKVQNSEGCILHSNMVTIQSDPKTKYKINYSDTVICDNTNAMLRVNTSFPITWNNGAMTSIITVNKPGTYFASTAYECGATITDTVLINVLPTTKPQTKNDTVPLTGKANLKATGNGVLTWYASPQGGNVLATGTTFNTPPLDKTTTYYVQSTVTKPGFRFNGGIKDFSGTTKFTSDNFTGKLFFDLNADIILRSVKVYADTAGTREILLVNTNGIVLNSKIQRIEKGASVINLNFSIPAGLNYALTTNDTTSIKLFGTKSPKLYSTIDSVKYPIVNGPLTIFGTNGDANSYYYFYDWQMNYPDLNCISEREPVQAVLRTVGINDQSLLPIKYFPNPVTNRLTLDVSALKNGSIVDLVLFDHAGRSILYKKSKLTNDKIELQNLNLQDGIYMLQLRSNEKVGVVKFVVIK